MASLTRGLQLLALAVRYALASASLVTAPLLSRATPCAEWDLEVLLDHVSDSAGVLAQAIAGGCAGVPPPGDEARRLDPVRSLHRQTARLLATCAAAGPAPRLVVIGDRELTTNMVALAGALEITVHGWDISVACGAGRPVPPGLAAILLPLAPLLITPATRPGLFADPVPVPAQACLGDQLVAFLGRQPRAASVG
ncbi:MAG: TIGR03086 family protein [Actinobacteria bacterium]|nr:TIGR03086 family protein [Actinomycetota bacterium]